MALVALVVTAGWFMAVRAPGMVPMLGSASDEGVSNAAPAPAVAAGPRLTKKAYRARMTAICKASEERHALIPAIPHGYDGLVLLAEYEHVEFTRLRNEFSAVRPPEEWEGLHQYAVIESVQQMLRSTNWVRTRIMNAGLTQSGLKWWYGQLMSNMDAANAGFREMAIPVCADRKPAAVEGT